MEFFDVIYIGLIFLVAIYAENLGRSGILWLLASIFFSPIITGVILAVIGRAD